jgi:DNA replication factor GINS
MYNELYAAWQLEIENLALQALPSDFYIRISSYIKQIKVQDQSADQNIVKLKLLEQERKNVNRMVRELLRARYKKILKTVKGGQKLLPDILTSEETEFLTGLLPFAEAFNLFVKSLLQGQPPKTKTEHLEAKSSPAETSHKRVVVRFLKAIPAIVGSDMKTYGPFQPEDVGSLPIENAKILVKQGLAQNIEVS